MRGTRSRLSSPPPVDLLLAGDGIFDLFTLNPKIKVHDTIMSLVGTAKRSRLREEAAAVGDGHLMLNSLKHHFLAITSS